MKNSWIKIKLALQTPFQKIRNRFLAAMILLAVPPLFILGYISFDISKETLMATNTQNNQDQLRTSSEVADLLYRNILNMNESIVLNNGVRDSLRNARDVASSDRYTIRDEIVRQLQRMMNSNFISSRYVDSVCLIDLEFEPYCLGRSDNLGIYEQKDKRAIIEQTKWYKDVVKAQGKVRFLPDNVFGDSAKTFSTLKLFRNSDDLNGAPTGILVVNVSRAIFSAIFADNRAGGGEFIALDASEGDIRVIHPPGSAEVAKSLTGKLPDIYKRLEDQGFLIVNYKNETTGWMFLNVIQAKELLKESTKIGTATAVIASFIAAIAIIFSFFISGSITQPLLKLKKMMIDWTKGRRDFAEPFGQDEVGVIGETFKRMASENEELNERLIHTELKEREAELRALQAQIKPHFLYNTLDSIYWMATLKNNHEVAQMAISLSESFKLSLNKGNEMIPVYKELKHIEHYLTIQNIRYNNRFEYIQDVDSAIMGMEMLKLIIQPLVENAIYHGLEPKVGAGKIMLHGKVKDGWITFVVEDDGVGIADMAAIEQGFGLRNVKERLKMYYGESSTFRITSEVGGGTRVEFRFYFQPKEVNDHA
ncbi:MULTISPECIES: sensor histidine kinase [Paenibacillus]|uniref:sensor histidine kinase n=1 Tax=Paenibacillus TaxID=44249 RepID=UPI00096CF1D1|nr:histidine kinase [Paenibacillus odorifer]OME08681.1 sensor histidine kinase [Paenibacillus odorifer]